MRLSAKLFEKGRPTERFARFLRDIKIPGETLLEINAALQAAFVPKKADGQAVERWILPKVLETISEHAIREHLGALGFLYKTTPKKTIYRRAGWPGAKVIRAGARLLDLVEAWKTGVRWDELVVFTGDRPRDTNEGYTEARAAINDTSTWGGTDDWDWESETKTEGDTMRWLWNVCDMPADMRAIRAVFVCAPMKPNPVAEGNPIRPNSEDPVHLWLKEHNPEPGSMLFSSGAPYGPAQNTAMWTILGPLGHEIETFGHAVPTQLGLEVLLREVAGTVYQIHKSLENSC